ncbi:MAG: hypothetical protein K2X41_12940 [Hyphomicrobium sp.]|nr:hypothetical protein [Hyphomicrobium sp.]
MKRETYRAALFIIPLTVAGLLTSVATAAPNDGKGGGDGGGRVQQSAPPSGDSGARSGGGAEKGVRLDRGDPGVQNNRASSGERSTRVERTDRGDRGNRMDRGDRGDRMDRGDRADRGGRRNNGYDGPRRNFSRGDGYRNDWRRGRRYNWGPGFAFYLNDGYYYGECNWLKRRARETGNPIWLRRFAQCRNSV